MASAATGKSGGEDYHAGDFGSSMTGRPEDIERRNQPGDAPLRQPISLDHDATSAGVYNCPVDIPPSWTYGTADWGSPFATTVNSRASLRFDRELVMATSDISGSGLTIRSREPQSIHVFDASAYIDQHVDVLQFLPDAAKKSVRPVPLFTLTGCSSLLVQTAGRIKSGATAHGRLFLQRTRAHLTGKAPSCPRGLQGGKGERAISGGPPQETQRENKVAATSLITHEKKGTKKTRGNARAFVDSLDGRGLWTFSLFEMAAEADRKRKERNWKRKAEFLQGASGEAQGVALEIVESAFKQLSAPGADLLVVLGDMLGEMQKVQDWLSEERTFAEAYTQTLNASATTSTAQRSGASRNRKLAAATSQAALLLEKNPGARRFLKRAMKSEIGRGNSVDSTSG